VIRLTAPLVSATHSTVGPLDVKTAEVTFDESTVPYVQATIVAASPDGSTVEAIEPRSGQRVAVTFDDRAALFGGVSTTRTADLYLQARSHTTGSGEVSLELRSDEQLLINDGLLLRNVKDWGRTSVRALAQAVLTDRGLGTLEVDYGAEANIDPAAAVQSPGQSFYDFLLGTLESTNLRLWCDEGRRWHLTDKGDLQPGLLSLDYAGTVTDLTDTVDLGSDDYADALVLRFSYLDASGNPQTSYDYAAVSGQHRKVLRVDFESAPPVAGAAARLLRRTRGRGRTLEHQAVSRFDIVPGQAFTATLADGAPVQSGKVRSVTYSVPDDRMTVGTRELLDTTPTMWAAQPAGLRWIDIPVGVTWRGFGGMPWSGVPTGTRWQDIPAGVRWSEYGQAT
jgi:hypothetical protein